MDNEKILEYAEKMVGHRLWCTLPFESFNVFPDGNVYHCCPAYTNNYSLGNIYSQSYEEIWHGEKAEIFRKSIEDGSFRYCDLQKCIPTNVHEMDIWNSYKTNSNQTLCKPKQIQLNLENVCNVSCIMCRDTNQIDASEKTINSKKHIFEKLIIPMCKDAEIVYLNGCGEFSVGKLSLFIIQKIQKIYPYIKFSLITNGILFGENMYRKLKLQNRIKKLCISVHAYNKSTYDKIVLHGNFDKVKQNIRFFAEERKKNQLRNYA